MTIEEFFDWLKTDLCDGQGYTIRIFGHGGSDKSTLAKEFLDLLEPEQVNLLETDPYILDGKWRILVVPKDFPQQKVTLACQSPMS